MVKKFKLIFFGGAFKRKSTAHTIFFEVLLLVICLTAVGFLCLRGSFADNKLMTTDAPYDISDIQQMLSDIGFYSGKITGINDGGTSEAVRRFQLFSGLSGSGGMDDVTYNLLRDECSAAVYGYSEGDVLLLARLIYAEAGKENWYKMLLVGAEAVRRTADPSHANTLAGVIFEPGEFKSVESGKIWCVPDERAVLAAKEALSGMLND